MTKAFSAVIKKKEEYKVDPKTAAYILTIERVANAIKLRGIYP